MEKHKLLAPEGCKQQKDRVRESEPRRQSSGTKQLKLLKAFQVAAYLWTAHTQNYGPANHNPQCIFQAQICKGSERLRNMEIINHMSKLQCCQQGYSDSLWYKNPTLEQGKKVTVIPFSCMLNCCSLDLGMVPRVSWWTPVPWRW